MTATKALHRAWKSAQLLVAFHLDPKGHRRERPHLWAPKNATASIHADPDAQETFLNLAAITNGDEPARDVQIKLRSDKVVLTRSEGIGWDGIVIEEKCLTVCVNGMWIRILADGSVSQNTDFGSTLVSSDSAVLKDTGDVKVFVAPDGLEVECRTPLKVTALTQEGVFERDT